MTLLAQILVGTLLMFQGDDQPSCIPSHIPNPPFVTPIATDDGFNDATVHGDYYGVDIDPARMKTISAIV